MRDGLFITVGSILLDTDYTNYFNRLFIFFFVAFKHRNIDDHNDNYGIGFLDRNNNKQYPYFGVSDTDFYIRKSPSSITKKNLDSKYRNKHLTIWFIKEKSKYYLRLSNNESLSTSASVNSFTTNKIFVEFNHNTKRISFTQFGGSFYSKRKEEEKINMIEKTKGTYFV